MCAAPPFDYCVITASTLAQARLYASLVRRRIDCGMYPDELQFRFYSDPQKGRVGSGGGTLVALKALFVQETGRAPFGPDGIDEPAIRAFFGKLRVLILHAGGESRRLPCYVPEGKLFGPLSVAAVSSVDCPPVVLDLLLSLYFKYPWCEGEVIMASGDVIVDFNTKELSQADRPFRRGSICGFGKAASFEQGSRHGVFAFDSIGTHAEIAAATLAVSGFHQKSPGPVLQAECLVPGTTNKCALDMGIFTMSVDWCLAFFRFAACCCAGSMRTAMDAVEESQLYFDFYLEVVIASLPQQTKEAYFKRMEGSSEMPLPALEALHACMQGLELRGALVSDAVFLHFGTLREFPQASMEVIEHSLMPCYAIKLCASTKVSGSAMSLDEHDTSKCRRSRDCVHLVNCSPDSVRVARADVAHVDLACTGKAVPEAAWVEMCSGITGTLSALGFHMLVGLRDISLPKLLPSGICIDARHIGGRQIVAVYSVKDTFKRAKSPSDVVFCGVSFPTWLTSRGLCAADVWDAAGEAAEATDLWTARLFRNYTSAVILQGYWDEASFAKEDFLGCPGRLSIGELNAMDSALERDWLRSEFFSAARSGAGAGL